VKVEIISITRCLGDSVYKSANLNLQNGVNFNEEMFLEGDLMASYIIIRTSHCRGVDMSNVVPYNLSASIMQALTRLVHKVSPTDVVRAQNLVRYASYLPL
jgi:hypothetical protein